MPAVHGAIGADDGIGPAARFVNAGSMAGNKNLLYVMDGLRGALRSVNLANGEVRTVGNIATAFRQPMWADDAYIYTVGPGTGLVEKFDLATGAIRPLASLPNLGVAPVFTYRAMWGDGINLYIGGNKKIYRVGIATGQVSVLAGKGLVTGANDEFFPKDDLSAAKTRVAFPQFAKGGGWSTTVALVNPSDSAIEGEMVFLLDDGAVDARRAYVIAPRSTFSVPLTDEGLEVGVGQVRVIPKTGHGAPDGVLLFSFRRNGITVTEASVPAVEPGFAFRTSVEANRAIQTGIALANAGTSPATVTLSLLSLRGEELGLTTALELPANGHRALFLREIPAFNFPLTDFRGVLRVTAEAGASISSLALRGRYNERDDFLVSTIQVIDENAAPPSQLIFPHLADGGGYTTEFLLFSASPQPAAGVLQFTGQSGAPLTLQLR